MSKKKFKPLFNQAEEAEMEPTQLPFDSQAPGQDMSDLMANPNEHQLRKPIEDDAQALERIRRSSGDLDTFYQEQIEKKWNLMERLSDRSMHKKVMNVRGEMFELSANHRMTMYDLLLQTRVQQTKELCDSKLQCLKSFYRRKVASYVMMQMEDLTMEIKGHQFRFIELMKGKHQYAESLKNVPSLHSNFMRSLFAEEVRYLQFLEKLIIKFEGTVNEELKLYSR